MKVIDLLNYLQSLPKECMDKELTYYDYKNNYAYSSPAIPTVVDESDDEYLDLVFNYPEEN